MSYSRWSCSMWYTFWCVHPEGSVENRDNAIFEICPWAQFTAKQLRDDMDACVQKVIDYGKNKSLTFHIDREVDSEDREELKGYMREFLEDVDATYNEKGGAT